MTINLHAPELRELKPRIMVAGIGGAGGNAVNNMIASGLVGVDFIVANTDAQALTSSRADRIVQMGLQVTEGLGAGAHPEIGRAAAEEAIEEIRDHLAGVHMVFVTAGMGGGTGTGAAPVIANMAREMGILTVGVVTKPFQFEGQRRMRVAEAGIGELQKSVDTLIVIPNQNLFRVANERTTFADAFSMADQVLYSGVACITDLMVKEGLINLDFADVRAIMREMGKAMMGTGEATGEKRAIQAAEAAIANPLLDETSMRGARGLLISITGGNDLTLYEVDEAASRIRQEVDEDANIILGATFDEKLEGVIRVSVVATGIDRVADMTEMNAAEQRIAETAARLRAQAAARQEAATRLAPPVVSTQPAPVVAPAPAPQPAPIAQAPAPAPVQAPAPAPAPVAQTPYVHPAQPVEAAPDYDDDVQLHPTAATPVYETPGYETYVRAAAPAPAPQPVYAAPVAEQPLRPQRLPSIEELPLPAQRQVAEHRQIAEPQHAVASRPIADPRLPAAANPVEAKRRTLLDRLSHWGMQRPEDATAAAPPPPRPAAPPAPTATHAEYAKRVAPPAPQGRLDLHGRVQPQPRQAEDDQLEIPAFLRRQSS